MKLLLFCLLFFSINAHAQEKPPEPPKEERPAYLDRPDPSLRLVNNLRDTFYVATQDGREVYLNKEAWQASTDPNKEWLSISSYSYRDKLFVGVLNPLVLTYSGQKYDKIGYGIPKYCRAVQTENGLNVIVGFEKEVEIKIYGQMNDGPPVKIGSKKFEVVTLPDKLKRAILADAGLPVQNKGSEDVIVAQPDIWPKYKTDSLGLQDMMNAALQYPPDALKKQIQGMMTADITLNAGGFVKDVQLNKSSPVKDAALFAEFRRLILLSSGRWFPALYQGLLVSTVFPLSVDFSIEDGRGGISLH